MKNDYLVLAAQLTEARKRIAELEEELVITEVCAELDIADLRAELANGAPKGSHAIKLKNSRTELKTLIEDAMRNTNTTSFAVESVGIVWKEMIRLAKLDTKPDHIVGYKARSIEYQGRRYYAHADERPDKFTKEALAEIFRRQRESHVGTRDPR